MQLQLTAYLSAAGLPQSEIDFALPHISEKSFSQGEYVIEVGQTNIPVGILADGIMKSYFQDDRGSEHILRFYRAGVEFSNYSPLVLEQPATMFFQAVTDVTVWLLDGRKFRTFFDRHQRWETIGRKAVELDAVDLEMRIRSFFQKDATQRYEEFLELYGDLTNSIRDYEIAAYVGVNPVSLSRLRAKKHTETRRNLKNKGDH